MVGHKLKWYVLWWDVEGKSYVDCRNTITFWSLISILGRRVKLVGFKSLWVPLVCVAMAKEHKIMAQLKKNCDDMDAMDISSGQWSYGILKHFVG